MRSIRHISILAVAAIALAACGGDEAAQQRTTTPSSPVPGTIEEGGTPASVVPRTTDATEDAPDNTDALAPSVGWIGGEPDWQGGSAGAEESAGYAAEDAMAVEADDTADRDSALEPVDPADELAPDTSPLRAGSVDDNADYQGFLDYLARIDDLGITVRPLDPSGRIVVTVVDAAGAAVAGTPVHVADADGAVVALHTTADGTVRFLPGLYGRATDGTFTVSSGDSAAEVAAGSEVALVVDGPGGAGEAGVPLDVLFLLDATGSMGDEIDRLKTSIDLIAARVDELEGTAGVRFAMTLYRDEGDAFVTATFDFTDDVAQFRTALSEVVADGGGDYPEALDEGLAEALTLPSWRPATDAVQLVFLVADAPPQVGRQLDMSYPASVREASERGIKVFPIASSDSDDQAEAVFRQIAQATGARFVFLSYGAGGAATGESSDIGPTDYEELALDDLVVRLVAEEIAALTGDDTVVPPPTPTTTTVPDGQ